MIFPYVLYTYNISFLDELIILRSPLAHVTVRHTRYSRTKEVAVGRESVGALQYTYAMGI